MLESNDIDSVLLLLVVEPSAVLVLGSLGGDEHLSAVGHRQAVDVTSHRHLPDLGQPVLLRGVINLPDVDLAVAGSGEGHVGIPDATQRRYPVAAMSVVSNSEGLLGGRGPCHNGAVLGSGQVAIHVNRGHAIHRGLVSLQQQVGILVQLPDSDGFVGAACDETILVYHVHTGNRVRVSKKAIRIRSVTEIPYLDGFVAGACVSLLTGGVDNRGSDLASVAAELVYARRLRIQSSVPHTNKLVRTDGDEEIFILSNGDPQDWLEVSTAIELFSPSRVHNLLAGLHIPLDDGAIFTPTVDCLVIIRDGCARRCQFVALEENWLLPSHF